MCSGLRFLCGALLLFLCCMFQFMAIAPASGAQATAYLPYPGADSVIINPFGVSDETALLLTALQPYFRASGGRNFSVDTHTGRSGATGIGMLLSRAGDGYNMAVVNLQTLILRSLASHPVYAMSDLHSVCVAAEAPLVLWVPENSPFRNIAELLRSARAYPGRLIIAGGGSGTIEHLTTLRLNFLAGTSIIYLPYLGTTTAMQAALMGQAHAAWGYPLPDFGRQMGMRPLAVAAAERLDSLGEVPVFGEQNVDLVEKSVFGLVLPASTSDNMRRQISALWQQVVNNAELQESLRSLGFTPRPLALGDLAALVRDESARLGALRLDFYLE